MASKVEFNTVEEAEKQLETWQKQLKEKELFFKKRQSEFDKHETVVITRNKYEELEKKKNEIEKKIRVIRQKIHAEFLTGVDGPYTPIYYTRSDQYGSGLQTNIRDNVLEVIKEVTGVAISKLKGSQIEDIVKDIITKRTNEYPELKPLQEQEETLAIEKDNVHKELERLQVDWGLNMLWSEIYHLKKNMIELSAVIKNPKSFTHKQELVEARQKAMSMIDKIYVKWKEKQKK